MQKTLKEIINELPPLVTKVPDLKTTMAAISTVDGRYAAATLPLANCSSEAALQRYRVAVEIEWFIFLADQGIIKIPVEKYELLRSIYYNYTLEDAVRIKEIERVRNHDVKAVEYYLVEIFPRLRLQDLISFIHICLTSEDVSNPAYLLGVTESNRIITGELYAILKELRQMLKAWRTVPMLAFTHGQPAIPTTMGKELLVFQDRLETLYFLLQKLTLKVKWGGAGGHFNAHRIAYPDKNWPQLAIDFVEQHLGFPSLRYTTQINHYASLSSYMHALSDLCSVLTDMDRDIWLYIMLRYLKQRPKKGEVGSSTMPQKINPIDFENSEGNALISRDMANFFPKELQISRLQRDLSDSTKLRNMGVMFGWLLIALKSCRRGLGKLDINPEVMKSDLDRNPAVLTEAIQTVMRSEGIVGGYEGLKKLTRGHDITLELLHKFIKQSELSPASQERLLKLRPETYLGFAIDEVDDYLAKSKDLYTGI